MAHGVTSHSPSLSSVNDTDHASGANRAKEPSPDGAAPAIAKRTLPWSKIAILGGLIGGLAVFLLSGAHQYLSFETFAANHEAISQWVGTYYIGAVLLFFLLYFVLVVFSIPGAVWMTIIGGYLFGTMESALYVVASATLGATTVFLLAKYVLGDAWKKKLGSGMMKKMSDGFTENGFSYLMVLRLVPLFPFWAVNLAPAMVGMKLKTYMSATALGIIPGTVVFCSVGNGLSSVLEAGGKPDLSIIFEPSVIGPLLGLAALSLIPIAYKKFAKGPSRHA